MAGLRAAYDRSLQTMLSMERALLKLGAQTRTPAAPPPESQPQPEPAVTRVAQEIAVLASEVESSKARQAQLEQRVDAHAGLLASLDAGQRDEGALAELRIELEQARLSAEASLQRALARSPEEARPDVPPASQKD